VQARTFALFSFAIWVPIGLGCIAALAKLDLLLGLAVIAVLIAIGGIVWTPPYTIYWAERTNAATLAKLGVPPSTPAPPSPLPPVSAEVSGSGRVSASASLIVLPPPETIRDHYRALRFLREARFPDETSRLNAVTWANILAIQFPYLLTKLPPDAEFEISRIQHEVKLEPFRELRREVRAYFDRNAMAWPLVKSSGGSGTSSDEAGRSQRPETVRSNEPESLPRGEPEARGGAATSSRGEPPSMLKAPKAGGITSEPLFDEILPVEAGNHSATHFELTKGTNVSGFVRETSNQTFDFYSMDRANYATFCETRESAEILEEYDRIALDFQAKIPRNGVWYFVVDAFGKQIEREVQLEIRASAPT
jgi:hypothetical protein